MSQGNVLVVDDNHDAADLLVIMLTMLGWQGHAVYSGFAAMDAVAKECPDIVLLDIGMPGMSGLTVAETLKARYGPHCPILVAVTAWSDPATKAACFEAGMALHLTKPVAMETLDHTLSALMPSA